MNKKDPIRPTSIKIPDELKADLQRIAERDSRTLSGLIIYYLKEAVKADKKEKGSDPE